MGPISREHEFVSWDQVRSSYDRVAGTYEARFLDELSGKPRDRELLGAFATAVAALRV